LSIRNRIFFVFITAVVVGFTLLANWISNDVADRYSESFEEVMVDSVNLLAEIITTDINDGDLKLLQLDDAFARLKNRRFSAQVYELEKTSVDIRVYVTDAEGIVVYDSDHIDVGEDYSNWRDVFRTLNGGYGARASKIDGAVSEQDPDKQLTVAYVAAPLFQNDKIIGVVTLAKPKTNIDRFVANAKANLFKAVIFTIILVLLLALMLYIWVSKPLHSLVEFADRLSRGERVSAPELGNNEIGHVGKAIERLYQALEDKQYVERYVESITHEIKSPLTAIHAAAELLADDLPEDVRKQFSDTIVKESQRLNDFANQLLQLASLEKCQQLDKSESLSLVELSESLIESQSLACDAKDIKLVTDFSVKGECCGDKLLVRQAMDNLFRNAIDFSPVGGTIRLEVIGQDDRVGFKVIDPGPGVPEFAMERIFDRFYSLPRPDTKQKSSGLGLNFAREVVALHGGELTLQNCHPGTCATLSLPRT